MKILIDGRLLANKPTGISRYTIELINSYNTKYGIENVIILLNKEISLNTTNKKIYTCYKPFNIFHFILFPFFFNNKNYDVYHSAFYSSFFFKLNNTYVITTVHDLMFYKVKGFFSENIIINSFSKFYFFFIVKFSIKNSDLVLSVSQTTQKDVLDKFKAQSVIIPEGVNYFTNQDPKNKLPDKLVKGKYFLYVGNGRRHKNLDFLINAFKYYKGDNKLVIVGNVNKKLLNNVGILQFEFVSDEDLSCFYSNCTAFIYPSLYEGFGLPIAESLGYGKLCLTSTSSSMPEVGGIFAEYADPYDANAWARLILRYTQFPEQLVYRERYIAVGYESPTWQAAAAHLLKASVMF